MLLEILEKEVWEDQGSIKHMHGDTILNEPTTGTAIKSNIIAGNHEEVEQPQSQERMATWFLKDSNQKMELAVDALALITILIGAAVLL